MSEILEIFPNSRQTSSAREDHMVFPFRSANSPAPAENQESPRDSVAPLIKRLCEALNAQQISYCHWKSNWKLDRWLTGLGDLDLLIDRADANRFASVAHGLGFKQAEPTPDRQVPGILNFYGFDREVDKFIHLHVHYQIVVGNDLTKNYHLPIESLLLQNAVKTDWLPIPPVELEFIIFIIRMVLKQSLLESASRSILNRKKAASALRRELDQLDEAADRARVANLLPQVASGIDHRLFDACVQALRSDSGWTRMKVRRELERRLKACARRPRTGDAALKIVRQLTRPVFAQLFGASGRKRMVNGGIVIALVGGDGAGKTTTLREVRTWLSKKFVTRRFHLGKPQKSLLTYALIILLRLRGLSTDNSKTTGPANIRQFPGYLQLLRWVSAGRDRCRVYTNARRFATNGGIALCDRYPLPSVELMEGPNIARRTMPSHRNRLVKRLMKMEAAYYRQMRLPELLIVLRVDPDIAVMRKTSETEYHVRSRSTEIWERNWDEFDAYVIDSSRPIEEVVAQIKSIIWSKL